jgi:hypothetical protein
MMDEFEKWYRANDIKPAYLPKDYAGNYTNVDTAMLYMAFRAGANAATPKQGDRTDSAGTVKAQRMPLLLI